jgi:phosphohistidine phosphatase SixA
MRLLLIRHASAGDRHHWDGDDRLRPLDEKGRRQAAALPELLADYAIARIVSSPYDRCVQTVEPLAAALGLAIEQRDEVAEGARHDEVRSLLAEVGPDAALCTHGDVIHLLLGEPTKKGAVSVIQVDGETIERERYLKPAKG